MSRHKSPCGTTEAYNTHRRGGMKHDDIDQACRDVHDAVTVKASNPRFAFDVIDDMVTFSIRDSNDARSFVASILDRALALEHSPYNRTGSKQEAKRLREMHKHFMSQLRANEVLP